MSSVKGDKVVLFGFILQALNTVDIWFPNENKSKAG